MKQQLEKTIQQIGGAAVSFIALLACALFLFSHSHQLVIAQETNNEQEQPSTPAPELKAFEDWVVQCSQPQDDTPKTCVMFYRILLDNGFPLLVFQITRTESEQNKGKFVGIFNVPLGAHLPSGIAVGIDDSDSFSLDFERCDQNGCYAGIILEDETIAALKQGKEAKVKFTDVASQIITATVSLAGFTAGINEL